MVAGGPSTAWMKASASLGRSSRTLRPRRREKASSSRKGTTVGFPRRHRGSAPEEDPLLLLLVDAGEVELRQELFGELPHEVSVY